MTRFFDLLRSTALASVLGTALFAPSMAFAGSSSVELVAPRCTLLGEEIVVDVRIGANAPNVVGLQSAISYNGNVLQFLGEAPGDAPFDLPIYFQHNPLARKIDLAVGISPPAAPSTGNVVAKRLRFRVIAAGSDCTPEQLVQFRSDKLVRNLLTDSEGAAIVPVLASLNELNLGPAPTIVAPPDITGTPAAGSATLFTSVGVVTASGCGPVLNLSFTRSDGATAVNAGFHVTDSPVTIVWTVTDECGRSASDTQIVVVDAAVGDLNNDNVIDASDLTFVLHAWGSQGNTGDVNGDGTVNAEDLSLILNNWGPVAP